jgi:hypothetical protein
MRHENIQISGSLRVQGVTKPPTGTRANRPSSPVTGSLYVEQSTTGSFLMVYTGIGNDTASTDNGWVRVSSQVNTNVGFKYRQIINYSYLAGGYKDSSPWKNVHKTVNATDQTSHIGELLDYPASYTSGACGKYIFFVWSVNTDGVWKSSSDIHGTYTSAINMANDTNYAHQGKFDILYTRSDVGTMFKETEWAYLFSGGSAIVEKFDMSTETIMTGYNLSTINGSDGGSAFSDENFGYGWTSSDGVKFSFYSETFTSSPMWGNHSQQKGISSKVGKGYAGNEGSYSGGYNLRRWSNINDTNLGNVAKPHGNCGEENFTMGQDWQYMLGNYDGLQNNTSWKFYYSTDSGTTSVSGLNPGVNAGTSSGHCGWRA